ncbi:MFS transporter [Pyrococcus kukulkanii]|uniref:MFS transporter n=1 Tax=Pyrococcus kukulkanii TaxID=1609559 RepID=UPI0035637645
MVLVTPIRERVEEDIHLERSILVKITKLSIPIAVIGVAGGITMNYMGPWFRDYFGINVEKIGWIFTFFMIFTGLGTLLSTYLAEKFSNYWIILIFTLLSGLSIFLLPFDGLFLAIALHTFRMLLINMETPIWDSLYVSYFTKNDRSTALALKSFAWTVSYGVSQYIGGWLFNKPLTWPFYVSGVIYVLSALLFAEIL